MNTTTTDETNVAAAIEVFQRDLDGIPISDLAVALARHIDTRAESLGINHGRHDKGMYLINLAWRIQQVATDAANIGE